MSPDLLENSLAQPSATRTRTTSSQSAPTASRLGLPIALGALAGGVWTGLAFFPHHSKLVLLVATLAATVCFAACFLAATASAKLWAERPSTLEALQQQLARCSFSTVVLLLFLPEYLARLTPPLLRSGLLLAIVALLWLALCTVSVLRDRGTRWPDKIIHTIAVSALTLLFLLTTALAVQKYRVFGYVGQDLAYFGQIMRTTLGGHLFWGNLLQDVIYSRPVTTDFAGHNSPIMFLFLPFYALFPSPITLLVLRNVVLLACALPVFLLARRTLPVATAWLWAAAFLATPAILSQTTFDFYPLTFVALPLLFTLYFFYESRYLSFCIALILTLLVREDLVFFAFGLGLIALLNRRSARWSLMPLGVATAWAALSFLVILPAALHGATFVTDACFAHLGHSPSGMLHNIFLHPRENILVHGNIVYLKSLLTAPGFLLPFASPVSLLSLPFLAINLLAGAGRCITTVIAAQYSVIPATVLFAATLLAITRPTRKGLLARCAGLGLHTASAAPMLLLALSCASLVFVTGQPQIDELREQPWGAEARHVLSLIPAEASVAAPRYLLPHLANRDCLYQTHRLAEYHTAVYEYLIIDTDWNHINAASLYRGQYEQLARSAAADPALQTLYTSPQYRVYRNPAQSGRTCAAPASDLTSDSTQSALSLP